ncbi:quinol dehydrogenase ferredoxin subunit NapH [Oceanithermus sp.]
MRSRLRRLYHRYRFLVLRRVVQVGILFLFFAANAWGWTVLTGDLSSSRLFDRITLADPLAVLQLLLAGGAVAVEVLLGAAIVLVAYALLGRAFCSWVCPVNLITDAAEWTRNRLGFREPPLMYLNRKMRYIVLVMVLVLSFLLALPVFEFVSPISAAARGVAFGMGMGWALLLAIFLFDLFVVRHGYCGHICPLGAFYSLISRFRVVRVRHVKDNCTLCGACFAACPETHVLSLVGKHDGTVNNPECTNCFRCVEVCDDDALFVSLTGGWSE